MHSVEEKLRSRFPDWSIFVVPPVRALPFIYFDIGKDEASGLENEKIADISWALQRWDVQEISVVGFASSIGDYDRFDNNSLAARGAQFVADKLKADGFTVDTRGEYTSFGQKRDERNYGINSFHRVEVRFSRSADLPEPLSEDEFLGTENTSADEGADEQPIPNSSQDVMDETIEGADSDQSQPAEEARPVSEQPDTSVSEMDNENSVEISP